MYLAVIAAITIVGKPQTVPEFGRFDYVAVDARRSRVYAAHTSSERLLVVDAKKNAVLRQIQVGPMHGVAVDEASGNVFTGNGTDNSVSRVDPVSGTIKATADVPGPVDAIAFDPAMNRVYADEDSGNRVFVIDAKRMKLIAAVKTPGDDHEYLAVDPVSHTVYQNLPGIDEFVAIDARTLRIVRTVRTPELRDNHPLMLDAKNRLVLVGGKNGVIAVYGMNGIKRSQATMPGGVDQCDFDALTRRVACAGEGRVWILQMNGNALHLVATKTIGNGVHTLAWDPSTRRIWTVWGAGSGSRVAKLQLNP